VRIARARRYTGKKKAYVAPKGIARHPAVEEVLDGEGQGFDYAHHVWLREGWRFTVGRMAGTRTGNFHTVASFLEAQPEETRK
jgi:hypothetical protein